MIVEVEAGVVYGYMSTSLRGTGKLRQLVAMVQNLVEVDLVVELLFISK